MSQSQLAPGDWVTHHARYKSDAPCFVHPDGTVISYGEADRQVTRMAHALRAYGIGKADRVAILATDSPEQVMLQLACMKLGATFAALNYRMSAPEIENLLRTTEPKALFISARYAAIVETGRKAVDADLRLFATLDPDAAEMTYARLIDEAPSEDELEAAAHDEDILSLALTSGTTGTPKGVLQSQKMIRALTIHGLLELGLQPNDVIYSGAPLFHISGIGHFLYGLARGAASVILPQFDSRQVMNWMQSGQLRHAMLIPSMIISILQEPGVRDSDYRGLRSIMYGGSPMPPSVIRQMVDVFACDLYNGFGAGTEAGGQAMFRPADHRRALAGEEHLLGSIGKPIFAVDLKLCDADGNEVPDGEVGEIWSRSDSVMSGYLNQPELYAKSVKDGWFHAGDLAYRDKDGYLFLAGRVDDMIIRGGENVYPVEIEDVIADHGSVLEIAVIGEPDAYWGEVVTAVVCLRPGMSLDYDELVAHCTERLAKYKIPHRLIVVDDLPKNPTGKVKKAQLRKSVVTGEIR